MCLFVKERFGHLHWQKARLILFQFIIGTLSLSRVSASNPQELSEV